MTVELAVPSTIDFDRTYTVEEFLNLDFPGDDENEYELIAGKIVAKDRIVWGKHGSITGRAIQHINNFLDNIPIGHGYALASCDLGQPKGLNFLDPDVSFVLAGRTLDKFRGPIPVAPDLIVEVWSPSDDTQKIYNKIEAYQQAGVRLIWSVYILSRFVIVYRLGESKRTFLDVDDELDGEAILPGFKLRVSKLFE